MVDWLMGHYLLPKPCLHVLQHKRPKAGFYPVLGLPDRYQLQVIVGFTFAELTTFAKIILFIAHQDEEQAMKDLGLT
jgi:hypothetical protein